MPFSGELEMRLAEVLVMTGDRDGAFDELGKLTKLPFGVNHGDSKLNPMWDDLRDDPRSTVSWRSSLCLWQLPLTSVPRRLAFPRTDSMFGSRSSNSLTFSSAENAEHGKNGTRKPELICANL